MVFGEHQILVTLKRLNTLLVLRFVDGVDTISIASYATLLGFAEFCHSKLQNGANLLGVVQCPTQPGNNDFPCNTREG
jgi:hypothetical protein